MSIRTYNVDAKIHKDFAEYCKKEGISMSKKIENFIKSELEKLKSKHPSHQSAAPLQSSQEDNSFSKYCN